MRPPTLSVLMCVYNHAAYVGEALEAILAQSRPADEVLVVDDGSTDGGAAIIEGVARRAPRVRLLRNDRNRGFAWSLERALAEAQGDYVHCAAADDRALPGLFEQSLALLAGHPAAAVCSARSMVIDAVGRPRGELWVPAVASSPACLGPEEVLALLDRDRAWFSGNTAIYRRDALVAAGGFDPALGAFCDGFACMVLARRHGACFIPEVLGAWRRTGRNVSLGAAADPAVSLDTMEGAARLMRTAHADLFPAGFVDRWERKWFRDLLATLLQEPGADLGACVARVPSPTPLDRVFLPLIRTAHPARGFLARVYLVASAGGPERRRILRSRFRPRPA